MTHVVGHLGRKVPTDWKHVEKYPLRSVLPETVDKAERTLSFLKSWRPFYDQGREGACVGFSSSQAMSILNRRRYNARWLWNRAKEIDEWEDTNPGDDNGTSVRAAMDILRDVGHCRLRRKGSYDPADEAAQWFSPDHSQGIQENRWATTVDELRSSIQKGVPVVMGTYWLKAFDRPIQKTNGEYWIDTTQWLDSGSRGGHAFMFNAASDRRQAFRTPNSWGSEYPQVWFPYEVVEKLIQMDGEATLITDKL